MHEAGTSVRIPMLKCPVVLQGRVITHFQIFVETLRLGSGEQEIAAAV